MRGKRDKAPINIAYAPMSPERRGFTLIEVLVVVAIIATLIALLLPALRTARSRAKTAVCLSNIRSIGGAMTMYMADHKGWLPVGPADKMCYTRYDNEKKKYLVSNAPGPGLKLVVWSDCHWGGRRAAYIHHWDPNNEGTPPQPERLKRPLTYYLYPRATLDSQTPLFQCPSDQGVDEEGWGEYSGVLGHGLGRNRPIYEVCGNSYYNNPWGYTRKFWQASGKSLKIASSLILAEDAVMYFDYRARRQTAGWHDRFSTHNVLFLDIHAETRWMDTTKDSGPGWIVPCYFDIMDFYH